MKISHLLLATVSSIALGIAPVYAQGVSPLIKGYELAPGAALANIGSQPGYVPATGLGSAANANTGTGVAASLATTLNTTGGLAGFSSLPGISATVAAGFSGYTIDPTGSADSTLGLQAALNYSATLPIIVPCGIYKTSSALTNIANSNFSGPPGAGYPNCVTIKSTSATADVLDVAYGNYYIGYITFDKSVTATAGYGINVSDNIGGRLDHIIVLDNYYGFRLGNTADAYCDYCSAQSNYSNGFNFLSTSSGSLQWQMTKPLAQFNNGWGFSTYVYGANVVTGQVFINPGTYENSSGGYIFSGDAGSSMNDVQMVSPYSSYDGGNGFEFDNLGANNVITGIFAEAAGTSTTGRGSGMAASGHGAGIVVQGAGSTASSALTIVGGHAQWNSYQGLAVTGGNIQKLTLVGFHTEDNNWNGAGSYPGIEIDTGYAVLSGVTSINNLHNWQPYGLGINNTTEPAKITVVGGQFSGSVYGCQYPPLGAGVLGSNCSGWQYALPTANGTSYPLTANYNALLIDTAVHSITTATTVFPSAPPDGTIISIAATSAATITFTAGSGDVMGCAGGSAALTATVAQRCRFYAGVSTTAPNGKWFAN